MNHPHLHVPTIMRQYGLKPDKRLGQNFLIDPIALERIVDAADLSPDDIVLEIGAGLGSLTRYLCLQAERVIAVELDTKLLAPLKHVLSSYQNVAIVQGDILLLDLNELIDEPSYKVVANIPYYITTKLIQHLLESSKSPYRIVVTVQHEVAMRICAQPGKLSLLALAVQVYGKPQLRARIPAGAFYPIPKVDSAVVCIESYPTPVIPLAQLDSFFLLARAGFSQKRKTLRNSLSSGLGWSGSRTEGLIKSAEIDPRRRAETLSLDEWHQLVSVFETGL